MSDDKFVWIDMETTGLDPKQEVPLELGFIITDIDLNEIDREAWTIFDEGWDDDGKYEAPHVDPFVLDMHEKSGLWKELPEHGIALQAVQVDAWKWLTKHGVEKTDPMCGSSVQFDREWLREWFPDTFDLFSHRNIDISTLKELMRRFSPDIYALMEDPMWGVAHGERITKRGIHRVLPDLEDTISEFKFYRKEFLYVPSDFA